jgi:AAA domain
VDVNKLKRGVKPAGSVSIEDALQEAGVLWYPASGVEIKLHCPDPDHEDNNPSASINSRTGAWICHACGSKGNLYTLLRDALGKERALELKALVAPEEGGSGTSESGGRRDVAGWPPAGEAFEPSPSEYDLDYVYEIEPGKEYFRVRKSRPASPDGRPRYSCSHPKQDRWGNVTRANNLGDARRRIPYRLPELRTADPSETVFVVEGEKDAEAVRAAGGVATTAFGGANGWKAGWGEAYLKDRVVVIVADRDDGPGIRAALQRRDDIEPHAAACRIVGARVGKDAADHLHNGHGLDEFVDYKPEPRDEPAVAVAPPTGTGTDGRAPDPGPHVGAPKPAVAVALPNETDTDGKPYRLTPLDGPIESIGWLWEGWIPDANITLLAGDGGVGKSTFLAGLAARLSRGDGINGGTPGNTLILSAEDSGTQIIGPRLRAANADLDRVRELHLPREDWNESLTFPHDAAVLAQAIRDFGAKLVILDPGNSHLDVENSHSDVDVRRALGPLAAVAMQENCAIVYLIHLNKASGVTFRHRVNGTVGTINQARSVLGMAQHPDEPGQVVLAHVKHNYSPRQQSLAFRTEVVKVTDGETTVTATALKKVGTIDLTADDLIAAPKKERGTPRLDLAKVLVKTTIAAGPVPAKELNDAATEAELSRDVLAGAKGELGVVTRKIGGRNMVGYEEQF